MIVQALCADLLLLVVLSNPSHGSDWPQAQADIHKAGIARGERVSQLLPRFSTALLNGSGDTVFVFSSPVVGGSTAYVGTPEGDLVAVNSRTGVEAWRIAKEGAMVGAPAYSGGVVLAGLTDGSIRALDVTANGVELWRFSASGPLAAPLTIATVNSETRVIAATTTGNLYCLRVGDGSLAWTATLSGRIWGSPSVGNAPPRVYVVTSDGRLSAVDAASGAVIWTTVDSEIPIGPVRASVAVLGTRLYVAALGEGLFCIEDTSTGPQKRWHQPLTGSITGSPAVVPSVGLDPPMIYLVNDAGVVYAIEDRGLSGEPAWSRDLGVRVAGSVAFADHYVFVASEDGKLHGLKADSGIEQFVASGTVSIDSSLAISHGRVYLIDNAGYFNAYGNVLDPPEGLSAMTLGTGQVHLSWTPVLQPPLDTPISGYGIYRSPNMDGSLVRIGYVNGFVLDEHGSPTGETGSVYVDTTITDSGIYYYAVTAMHDVGPEPGMEESTYSDLASVAVVVPPPAPSQVSALGGDSLIKITWAVPVSRYVSEIRLYRREGESGVLRLLRNLPPDSQRYTDIRVENRIPYSYALSCVGLAGEEGELTPLAVATPFTKDWPMYQRDARHDAYDPDVDLRGPLAYRWTITTLPYYFRDSQNVLVVSGTVFVGCDVGVSAYSVETGLLLWTVTLPSGTIHVPPAYFDGRLHVLHSGGLSVLDASDGWLEWSLGPEVVGYNHWDAPVISRGLVHINDTNLRLVAVDIETRSVLWSAWVRDLFGGFITAPPTAGGGRIYVPVYTLPTTGTVGVLDELTGQDVGSYHLDASTLWTVPPALDSGLFVAVDILGCVYGFETNGAGDPVWKLANPGNHRLAPAVAGSTVVITASDTTVVRGIRITDGFPLWTMTVGGNARGGPVILGGQAYISASDRLLYRVSLVDGQVTGTLDIGLDPNGKISAGSSHIIVPCDDDKIVAVTVGPPAPGGLTIIAGIGQFYLSWEKPRHAYPISGYRLSYSHEAGGEEYELPDAVDGSASTYVVSSTPGLVYYWRIRAKDSRGLWSDYAGPVSATAYFQPNIVAEISTPSEGEFHCVTGPLTVTVTGTANSGNFARYTLALDGQVVYEGKSPVQDGILGTVTLAENGNHAIRLTVYDETGETGQTVSIITAPAEDLTAQVDWPSLGTILVSDCDQVPFSLTIMGVAKGNNFTGYRLELARLSATYVVISSTAYETAVEATAPLGMVVLPDCDSYILRVISADTCGRTRTSEMQIGLDSGMMLVASIITFSTRGKDPGEHRKPTDVAVDHEGYVWVVDTLNRRVQKYTALGGYLFETGVKETGKAEGLTFREPVAAEVDEANRVLVLDRQDGSISRLDDSGGLIDIIAGEDFSRPEGLAVDAHDLIYVADTLNNRVVILDGQGLEHLTFGTGGDGPGQFNQPTGVRIDPLTGNIVVTDKGNNRVQVFDPTGLYLAGFGTQGAAPDQFSHPYETTAGVFRNMFTSDIANDRVAWRTLFGTGQNLVTLIPPSGYAGELFKQPHGLDTDDEESILYVADTGNNRIVGIRIRSNVLDTIQPRALLVSPAVGATVWGAVEVTGIVADAYFERYELEYGLGESPETFKLIATSNEPVWNGTLGLWDTRGLESGIYILRLTVMDKSGNQSQASVRVVLQGTTPPLIADVSALPVPFMPDRSGLTIRYRLSEPAEVRLVIQDSGSGLPIWRSETIAAGGTGGQLGANALLWDGRDEQGKVATPGQYTVVLVARAGDVRDRRAVMVEAAMSPELQAALHGGPVSGSGTRSPGGTVTGGAAGTAAANPVSSDGSPSSGTSGGTSLPADGTHDNGMSNGANPKDFERGSNPGQHKGDQ